MRCKNCGQVISLSERSKKIDDDLLCKIGFVCINNDRNNKDQLKIDELIQNAYEKGKKEGRRVGYRKGFEDAQNQTHYRKRKYRIKKKESRARQNLIAYFLHTIIRKPLYIFFTVVILTALIIAFNLLSKISLRSKYDNETPAYEATLSEASKSTYP